MPLRSLRIEASCAATRSLRVPGAADAGAGAADVVAGRGGERSRRRIPRGGRSGGAGRRRRRMGRLARRVVRLPDRIDPVAFVVERVGRERDAPHAPAVHGGPVDGSARAPHLAEGLADRHGLADLAPGMTERRDRDPVRHGVRLLARQRGQRLSGADLDEDHVGLAEQHAHRVGEADRLAEVRGPVAGIGELALGGPGPGDRADHRDAQRAQRGAAHQLAEGVDERVHHRRVRRERDRQPLHRDVVGEEARTRAWRSRPSGPDATHCSGALIAASDVCSSRSGRTASGSPMIAIIAPEPCSCISRPRAATSARASSSEKTPAEARRHVLAEAVADHRRRLDAPAHPQPGERVLDREQRRLGERGLTELARQPPADRPSARKEDVPQVEPRMRREDPSRTRRSPRGRPARCRTARRPCPGTARPGRGTGTRPGARGAGRDAGARSRAGRLRGAARTASSALSRHDRTRRCWQASPARPAACRPTSARSSSGVLARGGRPSCAASRVERGRRASRREEQELRARARAAAARAAAGASSSTTWALVPPMPNELTPARRGAVGRRPRAQLGVDEERAARRSRSAGWAFES